VVGPPLRLEVPGEAAPDAGRGTRGAQQGAVQQGEVVAEPDHSPLGGPLKAQGSRVEAEHVVHDRFGADGLHVRHALGRKQQALNLRRPAPASSGRPSHRGRVGRCTPISSLCIDCYRNCRRPGFFVA
jgi:hypothetical protein